MSLLQTQSVSLLGIGTGGVQDFATGIRTRRKSNAGLTREQALAQATANEGQDSRLRQNGAQGATYDPMKVDAARFMLNTNDKAFIEAFQQFGSTISGSTGGGREGASQFQQMGAKLLEKSKYTSRGDLSGHFKDAMKFLQGNQHLSERNMVQLQGIFGSMSGSIGKKLDVGVDLNSYQFEDAPAPITEPLRIARNKKKSPLGIR